MREGVVRASGWIRPSSSRPRPPRIVAHSSDISVLAWCFEADFSGDDPTIVRVAIDDGAPSGAAGVSGPGSA